MRKSHVVFLALLALSVSPRPAAAADRLACQTAGIITKCPADAQLAAGSVLQSAFVPWSAAPAGSIPNSALVTTPPTLSSSTPSAIGTAAAGVGTTASRFDHVHALPAVGTAGTYVYPISITTDAQGRATGITAGSAPQAASADLTALSSFGSGLGIPVRTATTPTWSISTALTGITISCASNTCSNIANSALVNSSVTVTAGTGLSGGGVVSLGGSVTVSLPSTGPGAGAIAYPASVTLDAQGRVTAATAGSAPALATRQVLAGSGLSGGGVLTGDVTISMPAVGTAGTYGYPSSVTTDAQGRVSSITAGSAPAALASTTPADVGTAAVGVGTTAARSDHVHGHGNQAGGSLHSVAVAAGAAGFLSGSDKSKLDGITSGAAAVGTATPQAVGTAAAGTAVAASREDHVHALPAVGTAGTYGYPSSITTDAQGRVSSVTAGNSVAAIANGGTNSSTALNSNRAVVTSGGKIVETASTCPVGTVLAGASPPDCSSAVTIGTSVATPRVDAPAAAGTLILNAVTGNAVQLSVNSGTVLAVASGGITASQPLAMSSQKITGVATATTSGDALSWPWVTATNGSASLSSSPYNIASGSFTSIGLALSLPSAGTYYLSADLRTLINASLGTGGFIECQLYNTTDSAAVANTERIGAYEPVINQQYYGQISINEVITIAAAKTIDVQCLRSGATTYTTSGVYSDANGRSRFSYIKVSP